MRAALDRPRLWRVTAALAALLLCGLVLVCAQGSLTIITHKPAADRQHAAGLPSWMAWCTRGIPREERKRLAFCARVEGRVISNFHIVLVRLPYWEATPKRGANVVAIGPLFRARDGQREVQAFWYDLT